MLAKFSVKKPVTITMMILIVIVLGAISLSKLSIDLLPNIELPIAVVQTTYSGAGPEEIENLITIPMEQAVVTIENIDTITSYSNEGSSLLLMQFNFGTDMDDATLQMREKIDLVKILIYMKDLMALLMNWNVDFLIQILCLIILM